MSHLLQRFECLYRQMYNICMGIELKIIKKDLTILQTLLSHELGFNLRSWSSVAIFLMILQYSLERMKSNRRIDWLDYPIHL